MVTSWRTACLLSVAALVSACVQPGHPSAGGEEGLAAPDMCSRAVPVPEGAHVCLVLDKKQYFLGENILVHYCVENRGVKPFHISMGGDYRFASRALRFHVTATGEDGQRAADPDPSGFCMGGLSWSPEVKPGEKFWETLQLIRYCRIETPGVYTLRVVHDLGWEETKDSKIPVAETTLRLAMPTPEQARQVVAEMRRLQKGRAGRSGERDSPYRDFSALQYPVYVPILYPRAKRGDEEALMAIGHIPSPEATQGLIDLLDWPQEDYLLDVAQTLNMRLPDPQLEGKAPPHSIWENSYDAHRRWLVKKAWRPELAPNVLAHARKLVVSRNVGLQECGAFMLQCLGLEAALSHVIRGLDIAVARTRDEPREEGIYPPPRGSCAALVRTARLLLERGAKPPAKPTSLGESVVFAIALRGEQPFRPEGWVESCAGLLQHKTAYVRQVTLEHVPQPMPAPLAALLPKLLADPDVDVLIAACSAVRESKAPSLRGPVLRLVGTTKEEGLLDDTVDAAVAVGARLESLQALVQRLGEHKMGPVAYQQILHALIDHRGGCFSTELSQEAANTLKRRWTRFLRDHAEAIRAGRMFKVGSKELRPDLLARGDTLRGDKAHLANPLGPEDKDHGRRSLESRFPIPLDDEDEGDQPE